MQVMPIEILDNRVAPSNQGQQQQVGFRLVEPPVCGGEEEYICQVNPRMFLVNRDQDAEDVVRNVRQDK